MGGEGSGLGAIITQMPDYNSNSIDELSTAIQDKSIKGVSVDDSGMDSVLVFHFTDGSSLRIRYDWIYEWEIDGITRTGGQQDERR